MNQRIQRLNVIVLTLVIAYTILIEKIILKTPIVSPLVDSIFTFLTSVGFYLIIIETIYKLIMKSKFLLKLYWGKLYLDGLWSYTYTLECDDEDENEVDEADSKEPRRFFGIWRFEQNLTETRVNGFGLTDKFIPRSRVRSIGDVIENRGAYEIINLRNDSSDPHREYYSKTSMIFDCNNRFIFNYPVVIRSKTTIYGGKLSGNIHLDVFTRHESANCEEDVIYELKQKYNHVDK